MAVSTRASLIVVLGVALAAIGCDAGGLINADGGTAKEGKGGPPATELVNGGTLASNSKYRLFYVMGQPSPQGVATSPDHRMNGGLAGAVNSK